MSADAFVSNCAEIEDERCSFFWPSHGSTDNWPLRRSGNLDKSHVSKYKSFWNAKNLHWVLAFNSGDSAQTFALYCAFYTWTSN